MRILVLSPYPAHSHRLWVEQLVEGFPDIDWQVLDLPARHFSWRIRSNALHWYLRGALAEVRDPNLILATSMTDLAAFKGLFSRRFGSTPCIVYFHENQFAYPLTPGAAASVEPRMVNLYSALAADRVVFNSRCNRDTFLEGAARFLGRMPDRLPKRGLQEIADKSQVIPVPVREAFFQAAGAAPPPARLVWNHRWEHDKGPDGLLAAVAWLAQRGVAFRLELAGQRFQRVPGALAELERRFGSRVIDRGYLDETAYLRFLAAGGWVLSTARHDFQGLAVLEAAAAGCIPVVPDRLAYPEWLGPEYRYPSRGDAGEDGRELGRRIAALLACSEPPRPPDLDGLRFEALAGRYRDLFTALL